MFHRSVDINGDVITSPETYFKCLDQIRALIDEMEQEKIDRSDMHVQLLNLFRETLFFMTILPDRTIISQKGGDDDPGTAATE